MKKVLLILPLLLWVACEDSDEGESGDYIFTEFSDVFVMNSTLRIISFSDSSRREIESEWDGLNEIRFEVNDGVRDTIGLFIYNEYGIIIKQEYSNGYSIINEYFDGWKLISSISIDEMGDTTFLYNEWESDGLTVTNPYARYRYNEYGSVVANYHEEYGDWINHTLSDDGRRLLIYRDVQFCNGDYLITESPSIWNDNKNETLRSPIFDDDCNISTFSTKWIMVFDEYYHIISWKTYFRVGDEWIHDNTMIQEFDYDNPFQQIYP